MDMQYEQQQKHLQSQHQNEYMDDVIFPTKQEFLRYCKNCILTDVPDDLNLVNSKLVLYLKTIANHIQIFLHNDQDFYQFGLYLINSELYELNKVFCISKILSTLTLDALELNFKFFANYVLLLDCKNDSSLLQLILDYDGFKLLHKCIKFNFQTLMKFNEDSSQGTVLTLKKLCTIQLDLLFQICKYLSIPAEDLMVVDQFSVNYIFQSLIVAYNEEDFYNSAKFKFILALNEQFMIVSKDKAIPNIVFNTIQSTQISRNFIECLLIYFNRESDKVLQIMISKILYLIFTHHKTSEMFYSNDLNVLVDVLIRELTDLPDDEDSMKNTFLRVLYPILQNPQFIESSYKKSQLLSLLRFLAGEENGSSFFNQTETTKRLAKKCLSISWLTDEPEAVLRKEDLKPLELTQSNESSTSLHSMSKKRPPPVPQPRKLLRRACPPIPSPRLR